MLKTSLNENGQSSLIIYPRNFRGCLNQQIKLKSRRPFDYVCCCLLFGGPWRSRYIEVFASASSQIRTSWKSKEWVQSDSSPSHDGQPRPSPPWAEHNGEDLAKPRYLVYRLVLKHLGAVYICTWNSIFKLVKHKNGDLGLAKPLIQLNVYYRNTDIWTWKSIFKFVKRLKCLLFYFLPQRPPTQPPRYITCTWGACPSILPDETSPT